jgi:hypothetical protein
MAPTLMSWERKMLRKIYGPRCKHEMRRISIFMALQPLLGPGLFFSSIIIFTQTVGLLGRVMTPSQGRYLHAGQHKHRINSYTYIHVLSWIRTHDPSVLASEDSSCLRPRGHCDRQEAIWNYKMHGSRRILWLKSELHDWSGWGMSSEWMIPVYQKWYSTLHREEGVELEDPSCDG